MPIPLPKRVCSSRTLEGEEAVNDGEWLDERLAAQEGNLQDSLLDGEDRGSEGMAE